MARLIHQYTYPTYRLATRIEPARLAFKTLQIMVLGSVAIVLALAIVNTVLGAPAETPVYRPYG